MNGVTNSDTFTFFKMVIIHKLTCLLIRNLSRLDPAMGDDLKLYQNMKQKV